MTPTNRRDWWLAKLNGNAARDQRHQAAVRKQGAWLFRTSSDTLAGICYARLVLLHDQPAPPTLAYKLGDIPHVSGLAFRLARQSGAGERLLEWLLKVAVERGAKHYQRAFDPSLPPDDQTIPDEEIGIALCLNQHPYSLDVIRVAAQLLSSPRVNPQHLASLAEQERCEPVLLHIARAAAEHDPQLQPWACLRQHLRERRIHHTDALPHWSRFVSHTGVSSFGGPPRTDWLRRDE